MKQSGLERPEVWQAAMAFAETVCREAFPIWLLRNDLLCAIHFNAPRKASLPTWPKATEGIPCPTKFAFATLRVARPKDRCSTATSATYALGETSNVHNCPWLGP